MDPCLTWEVAPLHITVLSLGVLPHPIQELNGNDLLQTSEESPPPHPQSYLSLGVLPHPIQQLNGNDLLQTSEESPPPPSLTCPSVFFHTRYSSSMGMISCRPRKRAPLPPHNPILTCPSVFFHTRYRSSMGMISCRPRKRAPPHPQSYLSLSVLPHPIQQLNGNDLLQTSEESPPPPPTHSPSLTCPSVFFHTRYNSSMGMISCRPRKRACMRRRRPPLLLIMNWGWSSSLTTSRHLRCGTYNRWQHCFTNMQCSTRFLIRLSHV